MCGLFLGVFIVVLWYTPSETMAGNQNIPTRPIGKFGLKTSYWLVAHRISLKRALVVFLAFLSVSMYSYTIMLVIGLAQGREANLAMMAQLTQD